MPTSDSSDPRLGASDPLLIELAQARAALESVIRANAAARDAGRPEPCAEHVIANLADSVATAHRTAQAAGVDPPTTLADALTFDLERIGRSVHSTTRITVAHPHD